MLNIAWRASPTYFSLVLLGTILLGIVPPASAWMTKLVLDYVVDSVVSAGAISRFALFSVLVAYLCTMMVAKLVPILGGYWNSQLGRKLNLAVQRTMYGKLNKLPGLRHFEDQAFHDTMEVAGQGVNQAPRRALESIGSGAQGLITFLSFLGIVLTFSPLLAGAIIVSLVPQWWLEVEFGRRRLALLQAMSSNQRLSYSYGWLLSSAYSAKEVRAFGIGAHLLNRFIDLTTAIYAGQRNHELFVANRMALLSALSLAVAGATVVVVVTQASRGEVSIGDMTLFIAAVGGLGAGLTSVVHAFAGLDESMLFYDQYGKLLALPPDIEMAVAPVPVPTLTDCVEFRGVSFAYAEEAPPVLVDFSLVIPHGKCVALVGENGAGKSTIVKLLTRMYDPQAGGIYWNGREIREFDVDEFRCRLSVLFQDFLRYDMTVADNIAVGNIRCRPLIDTITAAAKRAGIHGAITNLERGYDTMLGRSFVSSMQSHTADLSGGQWQKIALARAYMRSADLLVLDEPTSSLDAKSEHRLFNDLVRLSRGRTSLVISHRFGTIRMADLVAVLEQGRVVEYGTHDSLIALGGRYSKLVAAHARSLRKKADPFEL